MSSSVKNNHHDTYTNPRLRPSTMQACVMQEDGRRRASVVSVYDLEGIVGRSWEQNTTFPRCIRDRVNSSCTISI
jgi:hypothetical protein